MTWRRGRRGCVWRPEERLDAQKIRHRCPEKLILALMKRTIDDLPMVRASTLVAQGYIGREAKTALIRFGDDGVEYQVGVTARCAFPAAAFGRCSSARGAAGALSGFVCSMIGRLVASASGRAD